MPDYSCYITIDNKLDVQLVYISKGTSEGYWEHDPPATIAANTPSTQFQVKDHVGPDGSAGWVKYRVDLADVHNDNDKPVITVSFNDPTGNNDNTFSMSTTTATGLLQLTNTPYPKRDHPLTVTGTVQYNTTMTTATVVTSVKIPNPQLNVYNTQGALHKANNLEIWNNTNAASFVDDSFPPVPGSFFPVSTDLTQPVTLNVTLNIDNNLVGVPFCVAADVGANSNVIINNDPQLFTGLGPQVISVTVQPAWSSTILPWGLAGDAVWKVTIGATTQAINIISSRLEIYAATRTLPNFYSNQIGVNVLRTLVLPAATAPLVDWPTYVINAAFANYGYKYDTNDGATNFTENGAGGDYELKRWVALKGTGTLINCYDQAGIVQIGLGLGLNGQSAWQYMAPFGYINTTDLIGVGACNNPFYSHNGTTAVIANNDPSRTGFDNHAFVTVPSKGNCIADATGGPHLTTETLSVYLAASIEQPGNTATTTILYSSNPAYGPGTAANVTQEAGITSINNGAPGFMGRLELSKASSDQKARLKIVMDRAKAGASQEEIFEFTNLNLAAVHEYLTRHDIPLLYHDHSVSVYGSKLAWVFGSHGTPTEIDLVILSSAADAETYFQNHLLKYQRNIDTIFTGPSEEHRKGRLCLVTEHVASESRSRMIWVQGNVFAHVFASVLIDELEETYLTHLNKLLVDGKVESDQHVLKPKLEDFNVPASIKVGQEFTIYASVTGSNRSSVVSGNNDVVILLSQDNSSQTFQFRAEKSGVAKLQFAFAHTTSGLVIPKELELTVISSSLE